MNEDGDGETEFNKSKDTFIAKKLTNKLSAINFENEADVVNSV